MQSSNKKNVFNKQFSGLEYPWAFATDGLVVDSHFHCWVCGVIFLHLTLFIPQVGDSISAGLVHMT